MLTRYLLALLLVVNLTGCATYRNTSQVQDGPGLEFKAADLKTFRANQDELIKELYALAGTGNPPHNGQWQDVIQAGMDFADSRCEAYMHALFRLNRDKKTVIAQTSLLGTATAGLMAAAKSAAQDVAAVAVLFGLTSSTVDNLTNNLLYELDPSSVRTLVKSLQAKFRSGLTEGYDSRPAAMRVIRAYAVLCVPANIEAEVNLAVKGSAPEGNSGDAKAGQPPEVSNASSAVSPETAQIDANTELLKGFVKPDGKTFDVNRRKQLEDFIRSKGLNVSVTSFMRQAQFAAARAEAVTTLKLK